VLLFWDWLPITILFMSLLAAFAADRAESLRLTPWLLLFFFVSGDLEPYVLMQLYPILIFSNIHFSASF
jgi:hypothetical protein